MATFKTVSYEVFIDLPADTVWNTMRDLTLAANYVPGVEDAWLVTDQREGVGASRKVRMRNGDIMDETVVEWTDGRGFVVNLHKEGQPALPFFRQCRFRYEIEPAGNRTLFRPAMHYETAPGFLGGLFAVLLKMPMTMMVRKVGLSMKKFYENGGARQPDQGEAA